MKNLKKASVALGLVMAAALIAGCTAEAGAADYVAYELAAVEEAVFETVEVAETDEAEAEGTVEVENDFDDESVWDEVNGFLIRQVEPIDWEELTTPFFQFGRRDGGFVEEARFVVLAPPAGSPDDVIWIQASFVPRPDETFPTQAAIYIGEMEEGATGLGMIFGRYGDVLWEIRGKGLQGIEHIFIQGDFEPGFGGFIRDDFGIRQ